ncbi:MAG TPA: LysE family translocator [Propionibacteriaceae bacterium]
MVLVVVAAPGADFVITLRNTITGGRAAGTATVLGVASASLIQGTLVSLGLGALIVQSQPVFTTLKWLGITYLTFLAVQSLRSAWRGEYSRVDAQPAVNDRARGLRQGFLTNITNPKMFVFYLSLLPQFVASDAPLRTWLAHAWTLPLVGTVWLLAVVVLGGALRERLLRPLVRRLMDTVSGLALLGFGIRLALQRD